MGFALAFFQTAEARRTLEGQWREACSDAGGPTADGMSLDSAELSVMTWGDARLIQCDGITQVASLRAPGDSSGSDLGRGGTAGQFRPEDALGSWRDDGAATLAGLRGSFTLARHDASDGSLTLARDRFGTRPLFYCRRPGAVFASTDPQLLMRVLAGRNIDQGALLRSLRFRFNVEVQHLISGLEQVLAAGLVRFDADGRVSPHHYWNIPFNPESEGSLDHWVARTHAAFREFFRVERLEDQSVGVLLSGGVDSAVIAGAARECCREVTGYVARFRDGNDEEACRALAVAENLGITCHVIDFDEGRIEADLPRIVAALGEPPLHANNLVLLQLYERAARDVGVVLQGDAAEMMFGLADSRRVPQFAGKQALAERFLPHSFRLWMGRTLKQGDASARWRLARILENTPREFTLTLDEIRYSPAIRRIVEAAWQDARVNFPFSEMLDHYPDFDDGLQAYQSSTFLQCSTDRHYRLAQLAGVESIAPFISTPLVDVATRLPRRLRFTDTARPVVKALCDRIAHPEVSGWKKLGFPVPWSRWMKGPLVGLLGEPADYDELAKDLPPGFVATAWEARDVEALWFLMTLRILLAPR